MSASRYHRLHRATLVLGMLVALGAPVSAADNAADPKAPAKPSAEDTGMMGTNSGESIYQQICAGCHMADGRGAAVYIFTLMLPSR